jgi:hypothetical protein
VGGKPYWRVGSDAEHVEVLLEHETGQVFEWDGQVLDGPVAPSISHYIMWIAHLVYGESLG